MSGTLERVLSVTLVVCAVVIAGSVARREIWKSAPGSAPSRTEFIAGWHDALGIGIHVGNASAPVKIVEFADLECPACRRFQEVVRDLLRERPQDVSLVFVHFPLAGHRFALQAARAVECAESKGRFFELVEAIFAKQDSLGIKSWGSFASDAGISDTAAIGSCAINPAGVSRIDAGMALPQKFQLLGTPTVLVNGYRFTVPTKENLIRAIDAVRKGRRANDILE